MMKVYVCYIASNPWGEVSPPAAVFDREGQAIVFCEESSSFLNRWDYEEIEVGEEEDV